MSLDHAFFYKSINGDRVYDDSSFEHWLKKFFTSGVFLNDLQVTANEDMTVTVGAGYTNIDGKVKIFESASSLIIETAGASYPRIDSIVLERNDTERDILLKVVKGGYSSEPVAHTPVRQDGVYQLVIAQVLVNAGAVKVTQTNITDTRSDSELCGIVAGAVDQIDFSQIQEQFDSYFAQYKTQIAADYTIYNEDMERYLNQMTEDFSAWFEGVRNQLDEDVAGHLLNLINDIKAEIGNLEELKTSSKESIVSAINEVKDGLDNAKVDTLVSLEEVEATTDISTPVGAGAIKQLNESLGGVYESLNAVEDIPIEYKVKYSNLYTCYYKKYGKIVFAKIDVKVSQSVSAGGVIAKLTLPNLPVGPVPSIGVSDGYINVSGEICTNTTLNSGAEFNAYFIMLLQ